MAITKEEWLDGIKAWEAVKKGALLNLEQAELYIDAINKKIAEME